MDKAETLFEKARLIWTVGNFLELANSPKLVEAQTFHFKMGHRIDFPIQLKCYVKPFMQLQDGSYRSAKIFLRLVQKPEDAEQVLITFHSRSNFQRGPSRRASADLSCGWGLLVFTLTWRDWLYSLTQSEPMQVILKITLYKPKPKPKEKKVTPELNVVSLSPSKQAYLLGEIEDKFKSIFIDKWTQHVEQWLAKLPTSKPLDVKIVSRDGVKFKVDANLLAIRCPALSKAVMKGPLDIGSKAVELLLHFVFKGFLPKGNSWSEEMVLPEITQAAHCYKLEELKGFLDLALGFVCTKRNVLGLLILADTQGMDRAKGELMNWIWKNADNKLLEHIEKFLTAVDPYYKGGKVEKRVRFALEGTHEKKLL